MTVKVWQIGSAHCDDLDTQVDEIATISNVASCYVRGQEERKRESSEGFDGQSNVPGQK